MDRFVDVIYGHEEVIKSVAYSPCSRFLLSGSTDCKVRLWDMKKIRTLEEYRDHSTSVSCVRFAPNGGWASLSREGEFFFYPRGSERVIYRFSTVAPNFEFTSDGQHIVTTQNNRVILWNIKTRQAMYMQKHVNLDVLALAISPDGRFIASGGCEYFIRIWDTKEAKELPALDLHRSPVKALAFSPDSLTLASGDGGAVMAYWDMNKQGQDALSLQFNWSGHEINALAFSPVYPILASTGADGRVKLFDVGNANRRLEDMLGHNKHVHTLSFSPDGQHLASGGADHTIKVWKIKKPSYVA